MTPPAVAESTSRPATVPAVGARSVSSFAPIDTRAAARRRLLLDGPIVSNTHALAGGTPVLALDMYERSYQLDYGAAAERYVDAFMENINWANVARLIPSPL